MQLSESRKYRFAAGGQRHDDKASVMRVVLSADQASPGRSSGKLDGRVVALLHKLG